MFLDEREKVMVLVVGTDLQMCFWLNVMMLLAAVLVVGTDH